MGIPDMLSFKNKADYSFGIRKAFDDAFNQYARRTKQSYSDQKDEYISPIVDCIISFLNNENATFDECYTNCIVEAKKILNNNKYGIAQKLVNMSFKYMMCFSDYVEIIEKFKDCYLPIDKYTIAWVKAQKCRCINKKLTDINNAWANIDFELYKEIQDYAKEILSKEIHYKISYSAKAESNEYCILPSNRLQAEFVIWHQEKINEIHRILEKSKPDFERLGIQTI